MKIQMPFKGKYEQKMGMKKYKKNRITWNHIVQITFSFPFLYDNVIQLHDKHFSMRHCS
jgi:hypothetical protein